MIKQHWFSERLNQFIDLTRLSSEELIAELHAERRDALEMEKELSQR